MASTLSRTNHIHMDENKTSAAFQNTEVVTFQVCDFVDWSPAAPDRCDDAR